MDDPASKRFCYLLLDLEEGSRNLNQFRIFPSRRSSKHLERITKRRTSRAKGNLGIYFNLSFSRRRSSQRRKHYGSWVSCSCKVIKAYKITFAKVCADVIRGLIRNSFNCLSQNSRLRDDDLLGKLKIPSLNS